MSTDAYELVALTARYLFAAVMLLIVLRAARLTVLDSRKAAKLRRLSPMTGVIGELVVLEGDGHARRGVRYPVIREGMIGSSGRADVRVRHGSVRRRHAYFQMTKRGLAVRDHAGARLRNGDGAPVRELLLGDGDEFMVGGIRLLLVLNDGSVRSAKAETDDLFRASGRYDELDEPVRRPVGYDELDEPVRRPVGYDEPDEPVRRPVGYDELDEPVRRPVGYDELDEPVRRPSGYDEIDDGDRASGRYDRSDDSLRRTGDAGGQHGMSAEAAARRARSERREEFRQAMREGDALERRAARNPNRPRRSIDFSDRTAGRASAGADFSTGIAGDAYEDDFGPAAARHGVSDGIVSTSGRGAQVRPRRSSLETNVRKREVPPTGNLFMEDEEDW